MAFFDQMSQKLSQTGRDAVQKTKYMAEVVRLNNTVSEEQRKIEVNYRDIGKIYYEKYSDNPDPALQNYVELIRQSEASIHGMKTMIQQLKGSVTCPVCGSELPSGSIFCNNCGNRISESAVQTEPEGGIICKACGAVMQEGMSFCTNCGAKLETGSESPT